MNGVVGLDADDSEFVEVDPTGRYGRVWASFSFNYLLPIDIFFEFYLISCFLIAV